MPHALPSGEQIEIRAGDQRVVVVEVGGGLRSYTVGDRDVLDGYGEEEMSAAGRGQLLVPWPSRIEDGAYEFAGRRHQLALTEPEAGNAIHGLVRFVNWSVGAREAGRVVMGHTLHPQPGYPFSLALSVEYTLSDAGLRVATTATNVGREACPYGCGTHPYLTVATETVDTSVLRAPGRTVLQVDERGIPVSADRVETTEYDFLRARPIGATKIDNTFTDLERGDDGLARVELRHPDGDTKVSLWLDSSYRYLTLFTGDTQPSVDRRSIAVEPITCPPNAFRSGESIVVLEPGESTTSLWGIEP
jgi:aldose 1-epimerase